MTIGAIRSLSAAGGGIGLACRGSVRGLRRCSSRPILLPLAALRFVRTLIVWGSRRRVVRSVPADQVVERRAVAPGREVVEERRVAPAREQVVEERRYREPGY